MKYLLIYVLWEKFQQVDFIVNITKGSKKGDIPMRLSP